MQRLFLDDFDLAFRRQTQHGEMFAHSVIPIRHTSFVEQCNQPPDKISLTKRIGQTRSESLLFDGFLYRRVKYARRAKNSPRFFPLACSIASVRRTLTRVVTLLV